MKPFAPTLDVDNDNDLRRHRHPGSARRARLLLAFLIAAGICVDLVVRSRPWSVAGTALIIVLAVIVMGQAIRVQAVAFALVASVVGICLSVRVSPWLVPLDIAAVALLLMLGATHARGGSVLDLSPGSILVRCGRVVIGLFSAPALLLDRVAAAAPLSSESVRQRVRAIARGLGLALPVLVVVGGLLASADAVFASFLTVPGDPASWPGHVVLVATGIWVGCALVWLSIDQWEPARRPPPIRLGSVETSVVLGALVALYGLFVAAQIVAAGAGEQYIIHTTGLTRAEYARSGFFQLLWAAGLTLVVLLAVRHCASPGTRPARMLRALYLAAVGLTVAVVAVAVHRLNLYDAAFGLTMLRLYSTIFAIWLGITFLIVGVYLIGRAARPWWVAAVGASACIGLIVVNAANPEQLVVEHNVARAGAGTNVDVDYLAELSDDAVPALAASLDELPPADRRVVELFLCRNWQRAEDSRREAEPWFAVNASASRAESARRDVCAF